MLTTGVGLQEARERATEYPAATRGEGAVGGGEGRRERERERLAEERTTKYLEEVATRHDASNRALYELIVVSHLFIFTQRMHVIMFVYISNKYD